MNKYILIHSGFLETLLLAAKFVDSRVEVEMNSDSVKSEIVRSLRQCFLDGLGSNEKQLLNLIDDYLKSSNEQRIKEIKDKYDNILNIGLVLFEQQNEIDELKEKLKKLTD